MELEIQIKFCKPTNIKYVLMLKSIIKNLSYCYDAIDYEFADATPHEWVEVLFVVEFDLLA